ncbi:VWA domain-containing protein [Paraburkholderia sp. J8-2]|uniref:VWA domain-containing protein n=1 Tax=Paraburkholderia sp. J8-2 TaxID=2805440 RepID=UPI002AB71794|nr:VWA domain-containing protein [Paraburkholderia sp. J8-2]
MALTLNLEKATTSLRLNLEKAGIHTPPELEVGIGLDVSQSFEDEHVDGITNTLITRLIPWALAFDPDKKIDCFTFSDGPHHVHDVGPITVENLEGFVKKQVIGRVDGWNGGTDYSHVVERYLAHFGWAQVVEKASFIGKLFGHKDRVISSGEKRKSLVIVITDGDNDDKDRTIEVLRASEQRKDEVYFIFLGVSNQGTKFPFIEKLGNMFGNVGFYGVSNLREFVKLTDDEFNEALITDELIDWLKS